VNARLASVASVLVLAACTHPGTPAPAPKLDSPAAPATRDDWTQPLPDGVAWQVVVAGQRRAPDGTFELTIEEPGPVAPGSDARYRLVIRPGDGYKINVCREGETDCTDYAIKLSIAPPDGVAAARTELVRDEAIEAIDEHQLVVAFAVTPTAAGDYEMPARLKFAVCQASSCLPQRVDLRIAVAAR
jgi:hypothetical protein